MGRKILRVLYDNILITARARRRLVMPPLDQPC